MSNSRRARAFTLIEILIVIIIIAIMSSILVPAYGRFLAKSRFDAATRDVQSVFTHAREQAIARDTTATVTFNAGSETFAVSLAPSPPQTDQPAAFNSADTGEATAGPASYSVQLNEEYAISEFNTGGSSPNAGGGRGGQGVQTVRFRGDGTAESAQITLVSARDGYVAHLIVWPATGRTTLEDR